MSDKACNWTQDSDGTYQTDCGHAFFFDTGGATENQAAFCIYCGGKLIDAPFLETDVLEP